MVSLCYVSAQNNSQELITDTNSTSLVESESETGSSIANCTWSPSSIAFECKNEDYQAPKTCNFDMLTGITAFPEEYSFQNIVQLIKEKIQLPQNANIRKILLESDNLQEQKIKQISRTVPANTKFILHQTILSCGSIIEMRTSNIEIRAEAIGKHYEDYDDESPWVDSDETLFEQEDSSEEFSGPSGNQKNDEDDHDKHFNCLDWDIGCNHDEQGGHHQNNHLHAAADTSGEEPPRITRVGNFHRSATDSNSNINIVNPHKGSSGIAIEILNALISLNLILGCILI